jgi:hypothetical protein
MIIVEDCRFWSGEPHQITDVEEYPVLIKLGMNNDAPDFRLRETEARKLASSLEEILEATQDLAETEN